MSENFLRRHPNLYKNQIKPHKGRTISIDGSKVQTIGIMNIKFRINGQHLRINCRIVRNLVYDFVLGWDFFDRYKCSIHPAEGYIMIRNEKVDLLPNSLDISSSHFSLAEDAVVPPLSKMFTPATFYINPADNITTSNTVEVEPLRQNSSSVAVGRSITRVENGQFMVELLNPFDTSLTVRASSVLGHVVFTSDEELENSIEPTDITLGFGGEDSGYESEGEDEGPKRKPASTRGAAAKESTDNPKKDSGFDATHELKVDYSTVAEDAVLKLPELKKLLEEKHANVFSKTERDRGRTNICTYQANVKPGPPIVIPPIRGTPEMQKEADRQVHDMLADGLVSHSTSPFSAPVIMVKKKTPGQWRLCTDFRRINARSERVVYPLPRIDDTLRRLRKPRFFSTMDLLKGFWQVPIAEEDRKFFAFSTGTMHVEYNVMPMGAVNATATMQALMALILRGLPPEHVVCFLDDILIASDTMEDHLEHIDLVLTALGRAGLKLNPEKCLFAQSSVSCLGHRLSREGISPDPANLAKIKKWKPPSSKSEVRSFLGLTGYYRQMIRGYASIAAPLTDLTKDDKVWAWTDKEQAAFTTLRDCLTSDTVMAYPDFTKPFWVKTDASKNAVGFVLTQKDGNQEKVIAYGSKKLTETQKGYCTYDREYFGILTAIRSYSHYLRHAKFYVVTDHRPLLNVRKIDPKTDATGRRVRWSIELNLYDFDVIYKKGKAHSDADALSRLESHEDYAEEEEFAVLAEDPTEYVLLGAVDSDTTTAVELICLDDKRKGLMEAQDNDATIKEIKEMVTTGTKMPENYPHRFYKTNFSRLVVQDNILFRKAICGSAKIPILQAVIPPSLVAKTLQDAHGTVFSGHPGHKRMIDMLSRHVVWPGIYKDVKQHVEKCPQCDIVSQPNPPVRAELQPMDPEFVFQHVCCDLIELPATKGWKYICVFMDVFSRHVSLYKFRDKTTLSFTKALDDYVSRVGCPVKLTCDNGSEFCSELVEAVTNVLGIKKRTSVVYRPQSQGMVERMNRQIIDQLTKRLKQFGDTWPQHMHYVALAHNASPAARTGESPNLVFFGRELPIPAFTDFAVNTLRNKHVKEYVDELKRRVKMVHEAVHSHAKATSAKTAEAYNRKVKHTPHEPGDLVYYKQAQKDRTKLDPKYAGPVKVAKRHDHMPDKPGTRYTLEFKDGERIMRTYDQLKRTMADLKEPISKEDLPLTPAPKISMTPFRALLTAEDLLPPTTNPEAPIAARTRSKRPTAPSGAVVSEPVARRLPLRHATPVPQGQTCPDINLTARDNVMGPTANVSHATPSPVSILNAHSGPHNAPTPPASSPPLYRGQSALEEIPHIVVSLAPSPDRTISNQGNSSLQLTSNPASLSMDGTLAEMWRENYQQALSTTPLEHSALEQPANTLHLVPPHADSSSPSSNGTSPEVSQQTMLRVPTPTPEADLSAHNAVTSTVASSHITTGHNSWPADQPGPSVEGLEPQPELTGAVGPLESQTSSEEPLSSSKSDDFLHFLDTFTEEMKDANSDGKVDVMYYKRYDMRRERQVYKDKNYQWWICRHKHKYNCPGKLKLFAPQVTDITKDSHVIEYTEHSHSPHRMKTYGKANIIIIRDNHRSRSRSMSVDRQSLSLSRLNSHDLADDFDPEILNDQIRSTPTDSALIAQGPPVRHDTQDLTDVMEETSQVDVRGYTIRRFSRRARGLGPPVAMDNSDDEED